MAIAFARSTVVASFFLIGISAIAIGSELAKPKLLAAKEEKRWVSAVESHQTMDGATVLQVLQHAAKLRPTKFKFELNDVGYNGESGEPVGVGISYWIGAKRLKDDYYVDLFYDIEPDGANLKVVVPQTQFTQDTIIEALEGGRDSFLLYIDKMYTTECIAPETKAKLC
ncbi:hypothetical protein [Rhizobium miluonense]|uniref:Uncharacterized protein n=1 Tax=Rhizobium miluonense TaxID=411945 RepID=A0A1C3XA54_9HYPH|nr:hypothetical protein [Rhizobium miluonense]SCB49079.1 hypothetical protein GA0061102_10718 [Rhizobium miluonense]